MAFGTSFANSLLDWIFRAESAPSLDADISISLHTADPGSDGSSEVGSGGSYARATVTRSTGAFAAASSKATENETQIDFPDSDESDGYSGDGSPVTVTHLGVWSDTTFLFGLPLTTPRTITVGQTNIRIAVGDFEPSLS